MLNLGSGGPAYMSDEVGYLAKAATIAGSTVHLTTSWFGGYSFLISPAFMLSSNPFIEWYIILALNAAMWAGSAALLQYVLRQTHKQAGFGKIQLVTLGAMLYPSWISMSGYAFATSGFVLFFMATLASFIKSRGTDLRWLTVSALCAGYLCWIHPLGFLFLGLFVAILTAQAVIKKRWLNLIAPTAGLITAASYILVVHPWLSRAMSGSVGNTNHYTDGSTYDILSQLPTLGFWLQAGGLLIGFVFFTIIASFGLAVFAGIPIVKQAIEARREWKAIITDPARITPIISLLIIVGVIGFSAVSWGSQPFIRIDQWVYGRYTDMFILPLLGFGLMAAWKLKHALIAAAIVLVGGVALSAFTNPENTLFAFNNKVNIQSLWPMHAASVIHAPYYWLWGIMGAAGILFVGLLGSGRRKALLPLLILPIAFTGAGNYIYKQTVTTQHATVSSLYAYIQQNYSRQDCIGFTPVSDSHERFNLYSYYLHGYNIKKMSLEQWQASGCTGPYLTYDIAAANQSGLEIIGVEDKTNLYVLESPVPTTGTVAADDDTPILGEALKKSAIIFE